MEPHLYLRRGKKRILLVRYFEQLHFITLDHRMHNQVRDWFLAQPRTLEEMNKKQLSRSTVELSAIRGIAVGGLGRGQVVQFYLKEGKRRYELYEDCDQETLSFLFHGLDSFTPPKQQVAWQDWRLAQQEPGKRKILWSLGGAVNVIGMLSGWVTMGSGYRWPWLNWLCLLCFISAFILYFRFPAYFTILDSRRKYGEKRAAFGLFPVIIFTPLMMTAAALGNYHVFSWYKAWGIGALIVAGLAILLWKLAPEFRDPGEFIGFLLVGTLISCGPVLAVNFLLDTAPAQVVYAVVADSSVSSGKGGTHYYLFADMDGQEAKLPVSKNTYEENSTGSTIAVQYHEGALGIPYAQIE